jgi:hypothetical protein
MYITNRRYSGFGRSDALASHRLIRDCAADGADGRRRHEANGISECNPTI